MAYVYRHIRLDKNVPFYIGISKKDDGFKRAYDKNGRGKIWKDITNKTNYEVEILKYDITYQESINTEIELVSLYGRIDIGTGTLCNHTSGGEGLNSPNNEVREKLASYLRGKTPYNKGIPMPKNQYAEMLSRVESQKIKVAKYSIDGNLIKVYDSVIGAAKSNKLNQGSITNCCKKNGSFYGGFVWMYADGGAIGKIDPYNLRFKKVLKFDVQKNLLKEYNSLCEAAICLGNISCNKTIGKACRGVGIYKDHIFKGFIWRYKNSI